MQGQVLGPSDEGFDAARSLWNVRVDHRPDIIVRCLNADDVVAAAGFAKQEGLTLSVRGGGHSYAANTVADGGLLVDLSPMKTVLVDPDAGTAVVGPGVTTGEFDHGAQQHGLATTGATVSSVGVAGAALCGGTGYLARKFGLALDNLISIDLVTADGRLVRASETENPDLFWAMRGAGPNFGIATSLEFRLHSVGPEVLAGQIIYPFDEAGEMLRFFREFMAAAPDEFQCYPFMFRVPPIDLFPEEFHGQPVLDFVLCHLDSGAVDYAQPLRDLGTPILDMVGPLPYTAVQQSFDANLPKGQRYDSKAHYLNEITDAAVDAVVAHVPEMLGEFTAAYFEPLGGEISRVSDSATAFGGRDAGYTFHIIAGWVSPDDDGAVMGWASGLADEIAREATGGVYVNLLGDGEEGRIPAAYGDNFDRLVKLKAEWDPDNLFRVNHNIRA